MDNTAPPLDENDLKVLHQEDGLFVDRTASRDSVANRVCAEVTTLSPFVLGAGEALPPLVCVTIGGAKVVIGKLSTPAGDETISIEGTLVLSVPINPALNPIANGLNLVVRDAKGALVELPVPSGAFTSSAGKGWKVNRAGTTWTYVDNGPSPPGGIYKVVVQDQSKKTPGLVKFTAKGKRGSYTVSGADLPVTARIVLAPPDQCGQITFDGSVPAPVCRFNTSGSKLTCR